MVYEINASQNPLVKGDLYEGRTVCFSDVQNNPNNIGILLAIKNETIKGVWKARINNVVYHFDINGKCYEDSSKRLYGIVSNITLDIQQNNYVTRDNSTTTLNDLTPKDQFAICALQSLIGSMPNAISMDDSTILALAIKSYKISQAMLYVGTLARGEDSTPSSSSSDPVNVDSNNLNDNI